MKYNLWIIIFFLILCGCSSINSGLEPAESVKSSSVKENPSTQGWIWDASLYSVSADHLTIERTPNRDAEYHFNVTRLAEPPNCANCLKISNVKVQGDGTIKVDVTLRHPFPGTPYYTGFDVRGTLIFQATRYWKYEPEWLCNEDQEGLFTAGFVPLNFSRAEDGGGQLLNADGFTLYFFPGFHVPGFDLPIFKYQKGKQAYGPDPDSTVNGYKVFSNDPDRKMFLVTDVITRTYHLDPPDGEFIFGYVVDANWTPPTKTPVTDPKNDFPPWANCEDGYTLLSEQIRPFKLKTYGPPECVDWPGPPEYDERFVTATTIQAYTMGADSPPTMLECYLVCPDLTPDPYRQTHGIAYSQTDDEILDPDGLTFKSYQCILMGTYDAIPGKYIALLVFLNSAFQHEWDKDDNYWPTQLYNTAFFDFITLDVVAGDG